MHMYVPDCDAVWNRALAAGGVEVQPMADQEWGDRWGLLRDPFGHLWGISTMLDAGEAQETI
jgi:PhnB protein